MVNVISRNKKIPEYNPVTKTPSKKVIIIFVSS